MADHSKIVDGLNKLIATNYDGEKGYKESAEETTNTQLKGWFQEYAQQRYDFGHELKSEIRQLGGEVDKGTSLAGDAHRLFLNLKSLVMGSDNEAILEEVIRGEEKAIERYDEVLELLMPASTNAVVKRQRDQIQQALGKIRQLEHQA